MSRLIDADLLLENAIKYNIGRTSFEEMIKCVNEQPTAYDLEAVVQQLEERIEHHVKLVNYEMNMGTIVDVERHKEAIKVTEKAIEIVRNGGVK